jgi:hypothetical protein
MLVITLGAAAYRLSQTSLSLREGLAGFGMISVDYAKRKPLVIIITSPAV